MLKKNIEFKSFLNIKKNKTLEKWLKKKINYYTHQKLVKSFSNNYSYTFQKINLNKYKNFKNFNIIFNLISSYDEFTIFQSFMEI